MQKLSNLMTPPSDADRHAFASVTGTLPAINPGELALIIRALQAFEVQMNVEAGKSYIASRAVKETDQKHQRELEFIADQFCRDGLDAANIARRICRRA